VEFFAEPGFLALFAVSFLAATLLPLGSEALLLVMLSTGYAPLGCLLAAGAGNVLGGATTYGVGRLGNPLWLKRWGVSPQTLEDKKPLIDRWGSGLAFFAFVPIVGDPLLLALGFIRASAPVCLLWMGLGKILRYGALVFPFV
jgi:membrane protein YqaA with SNARE-associated domain